MNMKNQRNLYQLLPLIGLIIIGTIGRYVLFGMGVQSFPNFEIIMVVTFLAIMLIRSPLAQRLAAKGRSTALYYGHRLAGEWFAPGLWKDLAPTLPPLVQQLLTSLQRLIPAVERELAVLTQQVEAPAPMDLPVGMGRLTSQILEREICDWQRFENRRQVGSYTGMCPREDTSADRRFQGPINKHGNPRVRAALVELSWRLMRFQPHYRPVVKWHPVLLNPKTTRAKRKQIAVAIGRQFSVDWWRVRTGRCTPDRIGLKLKSAVLSPSQAQPPTPTSLAHISSRVSPSG